MIDNFYNKYKVPIISMGSGLGAIEYLSKNHNNNIDWICIDNDNNPVDFPPNNNQQKPFMEINYNSCDKLIENNSEIVGNCILFLNWCLPNDSYYDYEAIIKLKPIAVLSIYEIFDNESGASGGYLFHNWVHHNTEYHLKEENHLYADKYHIYDDELMDIRISWWESNNLNKFDETIHKNYPCVYHGNQKMQCCIQ